jgi:hypothetical protein
MSDSLGGYAVANRNTGEYVSKAVPTFAEAQKLLETVYASDRDNLMIRDLWSRPAEPRPEEPRCAQNCSGSGYPDIPNMVGHGDNSPG